MVTVEELEELISVPHNFIDITDYQHVSPSGLKVDRNLTFPDQPRRKEEVNDWKKLVSADQMRIYNDLLSAFFNRYYKSPTGEEASEKIFQIYSSLAKQHEGPVEVTKFPHAGFPQSSVIARIPGSGPDADEIVILGAHLDSTAGGATRASPGSDDDGSGSCTLLELFRILMKAGWVPSKTVEFHAYAAEEAGLLGSQDIANQYQKEGKKVYAMMQLDMTFYKGSVPQFGVVTDYVDPDLTAFLRLLVDAYSNLDWVNTRCGYGCSDHASWTRVGYPSCFPFEGTFGNKNPFIHSKDDVLSHLSIEHGVQFAYVALGFLIELASL